MLNQKLNAIKENAKAISYWATDEKLLKRVEQCIEELENFEELNEEEKTWIYEEYKDLWPWNN